MQLDQGKTNFGHCQPLNNAVWIVENRLRLRGADHAVAPRQNFAGAAARALN